MNKYTELSDLEINKKVAITFHKNSDFIEQYDNKTIYVDGNVFAPCNNPSDAMPIIIEYGISLIYQDRKFQFATNDGNIECSVSNPLKAAMIIFLCIKDEGNEKV